MKDMCFDLDPSIFSSKRKVVLQSSKFPIAIATEYTCIFFFFSFFPKSPPYKVKIIGG